MSGIRAGRKLKTLKARADWLEMRVGKREIAGKNVPWDRAELAALRWALEILEPMFPAKEEVASVADNIQA